MYKVYPDIKLKKHDELIYIFCYSGPKYVTQIAQAVFGPDWEKKKTELSKISERQPGPMFRLIEKGLLENVVRPKGVTTGGQFYLSKIEPITNELDIEKDQLSLLNDILSSNEFRSMIHFNVFKNISDIWNYVVMYSVLGYYLVKTNTPIVRTAKETMRIIGSSSSLNYEVFSDLIKNPSLSEKDMKNNIEVTKRFKKLSLQTLGKIMKTTSFSEVIMHSMFTLTSR